MIIFLFNDTLQLQLKSIIKQSRNQSISQLYIFHMIFTSIDLSLPERCDITSFKISHLSHICNFYTKNIQAKYVGMFVIYLYAKCHIPSAVVC